MISCLDLPMKYQIHLKYSECQENINRLFGFLLLTDTENLGVLKMLRAEYGRRAKLKPLSWLNTMKLPLKNVYTRLKIISRRKADFQVENEELGMYDIFQALGESEDIKMTLAEGSPGTGKTTFCLKLAYDWARGEMPTNCSFPKFEFVLLLKCLDINGDLMEAIKEQLLPEDIKEESWTKLSDFITDIDNQERILIILDGLDELPEKSRPCVYKLLNRRILPFCYVLATSRQETGIEFRKNCEFDLLLEIKGFTDEDAFQYIRKHFQNIGPGHPSKGESLIVEIKENDLLNALRNNPLNLILLCVVYEDYKGKLPTARTELYQVVVQCLLRRYCAKHSLMAPGENSVLEKQFEEDILALGELAWLCLLSERHGFRESELAALEIRYKGLVARDIGLLYKEESLKRLNPQHEFYFLHKTFQEYLAGAFIAQKLRENQLNLFERLSFDDLVVKYHGVFLFVSGILRRDASILFTQIGEELKNWGEWKWDSCTQSYLHTNVVSENYEESEGLLKSWDERGLAAATFFAASFRESGHDEEMATTLFSHIPFPQHIEMDLSDMNVVLPLINNNFNDQSANIFRVLEACKSFQTIQKPVEVTIHDAFDKKWDYPTVTKYIQFCSQLQTLSIFNSEVTLDLANTLHEGLSGNTTLSEFTLQVDGSIPCDAAAVIGEWLAARKSLRKVTFELHRVQGEAWASAIGTGLSADTLLCSVDLQVYGPLNDTAINGLGKLLSNKALTTFSLIISGDMQDCLTAVIGNRVAQQTALKSFYLCVIGNLSLFSASVLRNSLLENRSLNYLKVTVHSEAPHNWHSVVENLYSAEKTSVTFDFHPDPCSRITDNDFAYFCPGVMEKGLETKQHLTVVLWGQLSCDGAEALCEVLARAPLTSLTFKVHGKLTDVVANCFARNVKRHKALSSLTVDIWGELTPGTETVLRGLSGNGINVRLSVHDLLVVPDESCNAIEVPVESPVSLTSLFLKVSDTRKERVTLSITDNSDETEDWAHLLGDALAENTSLTALDLTINNYLMTTDVWKDLGESLLRNSSLTVLDLAVNDYTNMAEGWECTLVNSLAKVTSLTTLSLAVSRYGEMRTCLAEGFGYSLMPLNSLCKLSVVINDSDTHDFWSNFLRNCLEENTSLTVLCLTVNSYKEKKIDESSIHHPREHWIEGLADGLASTTSLRELTVAINNITSAESSWTAILTEGSSVNESITSLAVTVSDYESLSCRRWAYDLNKGLARTKMLTTLTLTVNDYTEGERHEYLATLLGYGVQENTSLTELNLTVNIRSEVSEDWLPSLCDVFVKSASLKTLRLQVNNQCGTGESRLYDLSKVSLQSESLSSFELTVTFYGD